MLTRLTLGAAIVATVALLTPASATPPASLAPASGQIQDGAVEQVHWRHRHRHRWHYRPYRHCRRVCHGHMHWSPYRGWHCHGHYDYRCHWH